MDVEVIDVEVENMEHQTTTGEAVVEPNEGGEAKTAENTTEKELPPRDENGDGEPVVGMEFESEDAGMNFYDAYARRLGFTSRVGQYTRSKYDGKTIGREFVCSRENLKKKNVEGCSAMLKIEKNDSFNIEKKDPNKWVVTKFIKEHNHSTVSPSKVHYLRPRRHFAGAAKNMAETYHELGTGGTVYLSMDGNRVSVETNYAESNIPPVESNHTVRNAGLITMNDRPPVSITTDQDRVIQAAVARVFPETRHCICKWHILREGQERLAHVCFCNPTFQGELYSCINLTETVEEFESSWESLLDKYDLKRDGWLQALYGARKQWAPVYFRDTFFAAISLKQGYETLSSFFDGYVNHQTTLPLFIRQYERALENSFAKEIEADFDTICTTPVLKTPSPMEKQAANLYTKAIFMKFQDELVETFVYTANKIEGDGPISTYRVAKYEDDKAYIVTLNFPEITASCSCQMFEYSGILCRHVLTVFTVTNVLTLPSHYILKRWTRNAKSGVASDERGGDLQGLESLTLRFNNLCLEAIKYAEEGAIAVETYNVAMSVLREGAKKIAAVKKNVARVAPPSLQVSGSSQEGSNRKNPLSASDMTPSLWPRQDEVIRHFNLNDVGAPTPPVADLNLPRMAPVSVNRDDGPPDNMVILPCFKSLTWVMENKNSSPANRVAVLNLKLQDYSKPTGEAEVKFQLSRITLEPMLRSMTYINEQLSRPANKVAVINLKVL
ncbi:hypothetical protein HHK36_011604 [Tetracentron sinense]|uniref:Protein FAR1-RELATED SEQUENCE n=1 Tax=Tetracentron sinense TaxID=13715 RepID=A0A834ZD96_TETSI|nr:hypothetical protein HHK36_011604 [Tetracentron sinense]